MEIETPNLGKPPTLIGFSPATLFYTVLQFIVFRMPRMRGLKVGALPWRVIPKWLRLDAFIKTWKAPKAPPPALNTAAPPPTAKAAPDHAVSAPKALAKGSAAAGTLSSYSEEFEDDKYSEGTRYSDSERTSSAK